MSTVISLRVAVCIITRRHTTPPTINHSVELLAGDFDIAIESIPRPARIKGAA